MTPAVRAENRAFPPAMSPKRPLAIVLLLITALYLTHLVRTLPLAPFHPLSKHTPPDDPDWSRYAYTQYATTELQLCNALMLFASLERLGSRAERVLVYPARVGPAWEDDGVAAVLLRRARDEFRVRVDPVGGLGRGGGEMWAEGYGRLLAFNQTGYSRVLQVDADGTVLKNMDELFLVSRATPAMPREDWIATAELPADHILLIEPSEAEFQRVQEEIQQVPGSSSAKKIIDSFYRSKALVLPHRGYALSTGELRHVEHTADPRSAGERWDIDEVMAGAKYIHFSDAPVSKPWLREEESLLDRYQPACVGGDCRVRDVWRGLYRDFAQRRMAVCGLGLVETLRWEDLMYRVPD